MLPTGAICFRTRKMRSDKRCQTLRPFFVLQEKLCQLSVCAKSICWLYVTICSELSVWTGASPIPYNTCYIIERASFFAVVDEVANRTIRKRVRFHNIYLDWLYEGHLDLLCISILRGIPPQRPSSLFIQSRSHVDPANLLAWRGAYLFWYDYSARVRPYRTCAAA